MQVFFFNHPYKITLYGLNISLVKYKFSYLLHEIWYGVGKNKSSGIVKFSISLGGRMI